jgi:type IV secretory pathway VirB10-like protein
VGGQTCPRCGAYAHADAAQCALCQQRLGPVVDPLTAPLAQVLAANVPAEMAHLNAAPPVPAQTPVAPAPAPEPEATPAPAAAVAPPPEWLAEPEAHQQPSAESVAADQAAAAWTPEPPAASAPPAPSGHTWDAESVPEAWVAESAAAELAAGRPAAAVDPETSVDAMLAMLAAEQHHLDNKQAPWTHYFDDKSTRFMIMVGGSIVLAFGLFAVMAIVGRVF